MRTFHIGGAAPRDAAVSRIVIVGRLIPGGRGFSYHTERRRKREHLSAPLLSVEQAAGSEEAVEGLIAPEGLVVGQCG